MSDLIQLLLSLLLQLSLSQLRLFPPLLLTCECCYVGPEVRDFESGLLFSLVQFLPLLRHLIQDLLLALNLLLLFINLFDLR